MKAITTNIWSFPQLIADECVYVDKTDLLHKLISSKDRSVFISRPRRFGKSLMLSTLRAIFEGRRELFEGLKISRSDYDWKTYPVFMMDMTSVRAEIVEGVRSGLNKIVRNLAEQISLDVEIEESPSQSFVNFWNAVEKKNLQVVVLVDEYDIPLQGWRGQPAEYEKVRQLLHDFYIHLKEKATSIRFLMLTGVTKVAKLGVFSGLNSPTDLTFDEAYATLLGYTHEELRSYFSPHIAAFAEKAGKTPDEIYQTLLDWYDHYRFCADSESCVVNPVSVGYALNQRKCRNYWMETGQTSIVIERLKAIGDLPIELDGMTADEAQLSVAEVQGKSINALLYQAGYLTIKDVNERGSIILGIPNFEVRETLAKEYLQTIIEDDTVGSVYDKQRWVEMELAKGNLEKALEVFRAAILEFPYEWLDKGKEGAAKVAFLSFFSAFRNVTIHPERQIANGRIDAIVETKDAIYIFEFKYGRTAQEAFDQIVENGYHLPYLNKPVQSTTPHATRHTPHFKLVYGIGINYNPRKKLRGIDEPVVKVVGC